MTKKTRAYVAEGKKSRFRVGDATPAPVRTFRKETVPAGTVNVPLAMEAYGGVKGRLRLGDTVKVIIKVDKENYVPEGVTVRSRVTPNLFTGSTRMEAVETLKRDPQVRAVELARPLRLQRS